jgi:hypothetical protein
MTGHEPGSAHHDLEDLGNDQMQRRGLTGLATATVEVAVGSNSLLSEARVRPRRSSIPRTWTYGDGIRTGPGKSNAFAMSSQS